MTSVPYSSHPRPPANGRRHHHSPCALPGQLSGDSKSPSRSASCHRNTSSMQAQRSVSALPFCPFEALSSWENVLPAEESSPQPPSAKSVQASPLNSLPGASSSPAPCTQRVPGPLTLLQCRDPPVAVQRQLPGEAGRCGEALRRRRPSPPQEPTAYYPAFGVPDIDSSSASSSSSSHSSRSSGSNNRVHQWAREQLPPNVNSKEATHELRGEPATRKQCQWLNDESEACREGDCETSNPHRPWPSSSAPRPLARALSRALSTSSVGGQAAGQTPCDTPSDALGASTASCGRRGRGRRLPLGGARKLLRGFTGGLTSRSSRTGEWTSSANASTESSSSAKGTPPSEGGDSYWSCTTSASSQNQSFQEMISSTSDRSCHSKYSLSQGEAVATTTSSSLLSSSSSSSSSTTARGIAAAEQQQQQQQQQTNDPPEVTAASGSGVSDADEELNHEAQRLIARCLTQERPAALVQAPSPVLDMASFMLGQEALEGEKRSDKIRRMLHLTDELRRRNAELACEFESDAARHGSPAAFLSARKSKSSSAARFLRRQASSFGAMLH